MSTSIAETVSAMTQALGIDEPAFPLDASRAILKWGFPESEQTLMQVLAEKCQDGTLTKAEAEELETFRRSGLLLALLHSKARRAIDLADESRTSPHGLAP